MGSKLEPLVRKVKGLLGPALRSPVVLEKLLQTGDKQDERLGLVGLALLGEGAVVRRRALRILGQPSVAERAAQAAVWALMLTRQLEETPQHAWYSDQAIRVLIERLFAGGIDAYEALTERNFPGLKDRFALYNRLPVVALVEYRREIKGAEDLRWGAISYSMVSVDEGQSQVEVHIEPNQAVFRSAPDRQRPQGLVAGDWTDVGTLRQTDLRSLLLPHSAPGFRGGKGGSAGSRAPIRAFAYRCIRQDLQGISASDLVKEIRR